MAHAVNLHSSHLATAPAQPASNTALRSFGKAVWATLARVGERRAAYHLEMLARSVQGDRPELASQLRAAARGSMDS